MYKLALSGIISFDTTQLILMVALIINRNTELENISCCQVNT